jgi:hypothetical protein
MPPGRTMSITARSTSHAARTSRISMALDASENRNPSDEKASPNRSRTSARFDNENPADTLSHALRLPEQTFEGDGLPLSARLPRCPFLELLPVGGALILAFVRMLILALMVIPAIILITGGMGAARGSSKNTGGRANPDHDEQQCRRHMSHFITRCRYAGLTMGKVNGSRAIVSKKRAKRVVMMSEVFSRVCRQSEARSPDPSPPVRDEGTRLQPTRYAVRRTDCGTAGDPCRCRPEAFTHCASPP